MIAGRSVKSMKKAELVQLLGLCLEDTKFAKHAEKKWAAREDQPVERVGFWDIEASNLDANFGICFSWCIKKAGGEILSDVITAKDLRDGLLDKRVVQSCVDALLQFDRIVTYFGARYDAPYMRSRAVYHKIAFPPYKALAHTDVYDLVKRKLKLNRSRLQTACDFMGIKSKGHPLLGPVWFNAIRGDEKALKYILVHNEEDVVALEKLYDALIGFGVKANNSI